MDTIKKISIWYLRITFITLVLNSLSLQTVCASDPDTTETEIHGEWQDKYRSLYPIIPITVHNSRNQLSIQNSDPFCNINIQITECSTGRVVYKVYVPQSETSYIIIPLNTLTSGQQYRLELQNNYGGYLYGNFEVRDL